MQKTTQDRLQSFIFTLEQGTGAALLKFASLLLGFVLLAFCYDVNNRNWFAGQEAMESSHLARQLAEGRGYTTESIRPLAVGLLRRADPGGAAQVLDRPVPDLSVAPGYPFLISCAMRVLPFQFTADRRQPWSYQPEEMIAAINEGLLFVAVLLVFQVARKLFDAGVAWLAAIIFCGTEIYWKFGVSGLSTIWLVVVFLLLVWCLLVFEERHRRSEMPGMGGSLALAVAAGALVGVGGLSRYSFALMILPVLVFLGRYAKGRGGKMCLGASAAFLLALGPWMARNLVLSGTPFGTAGYAVVEQTAPTLDRDWLERSLSTSGRVGTVRAPDVMNKLLLNEKVMLGNDFPRLGGGWMFAFFLCGLLLPFRSPALQRTRYFLVWSLLLMSVAQALGQTHLSQDSPEINSENLLVLLSPLVLIFGTGFFFTLLDQMAVAEPGYRRGVVGLFAAVMCGPMLLGLASTPLQESVSPYAPAHIQRTSAMMKPDELMMSDIPWAVAWYGDRPCAWLTLDDASAFNEFNAIKPVRAVYLTQKTSDSPFLSQMLYTQHGWGNFMLDGLPESAWPQGEVPSGFPLRNAALDYLPGQMFISDRIRWKNGANQ